MQAVYAKQAQVPTVIFTLTLSDRLSSQSASEKLLKSSVLLGLSGGLDADSALAFGAAGVGGLTLSLLGVRNGCDMHTHSHRPSVV